MYPQWANPSRVPWDSEEEEASVGWARQGELCAGSGVLVGKYFTFYKCANLGWLSPPGFLVELGDGVSAWPW